MVDYGLFRFAAAPRSGSTWVIKAAAEIGFPEMSKAALHTPHVGGYSTCLRAAMVRHPIHWMKSYYRSIYPGSCGVPAVDRFRCLKGGSFESFVLSYLNEMPGAISAMFASYNADSYMRVEDLPWCFAELLESVGVPAAARRRCYGLPPQNTFNGTTGKLLIPTHLATRVMAAEAEFCDTYEYFWN